MKAFPYFQWYPADAQTDENYNSMTDQELGFYHRCLNHAWMNDGLPSDLDRLAATMRVTREYLDMVWPAVSQCFVLTDTVIPRYVNRRQEEEREKAFSKSKKASESASVRSIRERTANAERTLSERTANDAARAYVSVSVSDSSSDSEKKEKPRVREMPRAIDLDRPTSQRFEEWFLIWSSVRGTNDRPGAAQAYLSVVTVEVENAAMACAKSYVEGPGADPTHGYKPSNFLFVQAKDGFQARWPKGRDSPSSGMSKTDAVKALALKNLQERGVIL